LFWKADQIKYNYSQYLQTKTFKHLIEMMLKHDPAERLSMEELVVHQWITGAFASDI
jgi:serine/threonine protein kinase